MRSTTRITLFPSTLVTSATVLSRLSMAPTFGDPRPAALLEDHTDVFEDDPVLPLTRTHRSLAPRVIAWARDPEQPTETRHPESFALFVDEREDIGFRAEVNRISFFKRACSSSSSAWARWSA
jgi:hypothetical protein